MNLSIRWVGVLALLAMPILAHAQSQPITLEDAVELFKENSLQPEMAKLEAERKKGEAREYTAYPNPQISVMREQLNAGSVDYEETTYQVSQPIELLGQPFLRKKSAARMKQAAELQYTHDLTRLITNVKSLYAEYWYLKNKLGVYDKALQQIEEIYQIVGDRKEEGLVSGLQLQRFRVALSRYRQQRDAVHLNMQEAGRKLQMMIYPGRPAEQSLHISDTLAVEPVFISQSVLLRTAPQARTDYQALGKLAQASKLQLKVAKRNRFPDLHVNLGYKTQSDGAEGFVIGGSIKLPIFNQNSGSIQVAQSEARLREVSLQLHEQKIKNDVIAAMQRLQLVQDRWEFLQQQSIDPSFLEISRFTYTQGRYSLIQLLDSIEAYVEGRSMLYQTIAEYNQARFKLDLVSGLELTSTP